MDLPDVEPAGSERSALAGPIDWSVKSRASNAGLSRSTRMQCDVYNVRLLRALPLRLLCLTIVAVLAIRPAAAASLSEDVPLPGGTAALAGALGIDPTPDRGRFVYEIARLLYDVPEGRKPTTEAFLQTLRQPPGRGRRPDIPDPRAAEIVPIPLTVDVWSNAIFHRRIAPREIVLAIVADRAAALLCLGLSTLDDGTLEYLGDHPALLERIYERSTPAFAAFAASLHIQNNRMVPAGGEAAVPLWETLVPEKMTRPDRFLLQLLELSEGRLAYFYDVVGQLDPARRAFVLGAWMPNAALRVDRFKALALGVGAFREAHLRTLPFGRASYDLTMTLMRLQVEADGTPRQPASRGFWTRVFSGSDVPDDSARLLRNADDDPVDAAWLSETIGSVDVRVRAERLDQIAFGQRVFGGAEPGQRGDVFVAVRALAHYRMLMWTLERMGIGAPEVYAAAARKAARLSALDGRRGFEAQAQFQGALAIVARMRAVRTIGVARARALVEQLVALPLTDDGHYAGAVARWLREEIAGPVRRDGTIESAVLAAMSGGPSGESSIARTVIWEGRPYRLDLGAAERRRLQQVRERQDGVPLDVPLELAADARALATEKATAEDLQAMLTRLNAAVGDIPRRVGHEVDDLPPAGVSQAPNARDTLRKAIDELTRDVRNKDVKRAARAAGPFTEASDALLAQALMSIAYAADVGDPEGAILLADDVSVRHDFGFGVKDADMRQRMSWAVPRIEVNPGSPWHVSGSLLGLDIGLAQLALRRLNYERVLEAPKLTSNERDTFALSVSLLNAFDLRDGDRDAIGEAIDRGRRRVASLIGDLAAFDRVADELSIEGWRRRAVRWMLTRETDRVAAMFSMTEMLALGAGLVPELHRWGMSMVASEGCPCSRLTPPGRWPTLLGRPPLGLTGSAVADLHLHAAIMLRELRLPAALAKVVLSGAAQDFIDDVRPTDDADWLTLARTARTVTRERIEDYIAAATAAGPLIPDSGTPAAAIK
jgi:hypothetical protein